MISKRVMMNSSRNNTGFTGQLIHIVRKYLECGDLHQGFARIKYPDCHHEYLLAFSCRGRWFCPSCHNKKVIPFGHHLKESVLYPVPHRQCVFSIPEILRKFFLYDRKLLGKLSRRHRMEFMPIFSQSVNKSSKTRILVFEISTNLLLKNCCFIENL